MTTRLRTALFVPASRPDRIEKAATYPTDAVVVDFEDAVAVDAKTHARHLAVESLTSLPRTPVAVLVRVNASDSPWFLDDVTALTPVLRRLSAVVLPKATAADQVRRLDTLLTGIESAEGLPAGSTGIVPIVETAAGVLAAAQIAAGSARIRTLLFGAADLSAELRVTATPDGDELLHARSQVVLAAASAHRARPLDGPHLTLGDHDGLLRSAQRARRLGFGGKAVIHPDQLATVVEVFSPTEDEIAWATAVDDAFTAAEASGEGAVRLADGTFADYPVARRARAILAEAEENRGSR